MFFKEVQVTCPYKLETRLKTISQHSGPLASRIKKNETNNSCKIQSQISLLKCFVRLDTDAQNLDGFRNLESTGVVDEHSDETYACSSQACDPEKQCVMAIKGEWWTQTAEDSAFTFMTLQLSLTLLCSQLFCSINVCNARLLHDPLKSKETMSLKGPTFP